MPSLWYLRDVAELTDTKFGCGMAVCGASSVRQDGKAIRSCSVAMQAVNGTRITTIEVISGKGLHPVQKAWMQIAVPQYGYCQTGQIMQAIALLNDNHSPSDKDIDETMWFLWTAYLGSDRRNGRTSDNATSGQNEYQTTNFSPSRLAKTCAVDTNCSH